MLRHTTAPNYHSWHIHCKTKRAILNVCSRVWMAHATDMRTVEPATDVGRVIIIVNYGRAFDKVRSIVAGTVDRFLRYSFEQVFPSVAQRVRQYERDARSFAVSASGDGRLQTT